MIDTDQADLLTEIREIDLTRQLLADLHNDLQGRLTRFRYLVDLGDTLGRGGTMIYGGHEAATAWIEARSSFVNGNYIATIFLCQGLLENLLAGYLNLGLDHEMPDRIQFRKTLQLCKEKGIIDVDDCTALASLVDLRNPLTHFRDVNDGESLMGRVLKTGIAPDELLARDAYFAVGVATKILSKPPFALSGERLHPFNERS
jgi:hypothetical protein